LNQTLKIKIQQKVKPYILQTRLIFNDLPEKEKLALKKNAIPGSAKRGHYLFRQGTYPKGVYWLISGKAKIFQETPSGQRQTLYVYTDGDLIGYRQLIADVPHPVNSKWLEDASWLHIPADRFRSMIRDSPLFARTMLTMLANEFTVWMNRMTVFTQFAVKDRLILALLILHEQYGADSDGVAITFTRTELAEYVGASLETVVRALNKLKAQKLVEIKGRVIKLNDVESLMEILKK
jgi:CRP-like cAMP-binding protein